MIHEYAFGAGRRLSRQKIHAKNCNKNIAILIMWTQEQWLFASKTKDFEVSQLKPSETELYRDLKWVFKRGYRGRTGQDK